MIGVVFRAPRSWVHPDLPKDVDRRARALPHHAHAIAGLWAASDPLAKYQRRMHYVTRCTCGAESATTDASTKICAACGSPAGRTRRSRVAG